MSRPAAILFDFDGVLIESEWAGNCHIAEFFSARGHALSPQEAVANFMGLAGEEFESAVTQWIGGPLPAEFVEARRNTALAMMRDGLDEVSGAIDFIRGLDCDIPIAVTSSANVQWIVAHLKHLGLRERFGRHVYSGREHVARMKPAPDIYLYAADRLGIAIGDCVILEDSPVGVTGALASGARVIGLLAGRHADENLEKRLRSAGVTELARSYDEVAALIA